MNQVARNLAYLLDPCLWFEQVLQPHLFPLDSWQREALGGPGVLGRGITGPGEKTICNCGRQCGKSFLLQTVSTWYSIFHPKTMTLFISVGERQAQENLRKVSEFLALAGVRGLLESNKLAIELQNKSRIIALPSDSATIRGYRVDLLLLDESSRIKPSTLVSVFPMLSLGGAVVAASTPAGQSGWFFETWTNGDPTWRRIKITSEENMRISRSFLAGEFRALPRRWYDQEYRVEFIADIASCFSSEDIMHIASSSVKRLPFDDGPGPDPEIPTFRREPEPEEL